MNPSGDFVTGRWITHKIHGTGLKTAMIGWDTLPKHLPVALSTPYLSSNMMKKELFTPWTMGLWK
jgi:hypothetical protein